MEVPSNNAEREETPNTPPLPSQVVTDILSRLPLKTVVAAKCVCKSWLNLVSRDTHLAKLHRQRSATTTELLLRPAADSTNLYFANIQFLHNPVSVDKVKISPLSNFSGFLKKRRNNLIFANSCNGLLCFHSLDSSYDSSYALIINPITGEFITVPMSAKWKEKIIPPVNYRLGFDEFENKFKLLQVMYRANSSEQFAKIRTFEEGAQWREIGDCPYPIPRSESKSVILAHKLHYDFVSSDLIINGIACFDFEEEQFGVVPIPSLLQHFSTSDSLFGVFGNSLSLCWCGADSYEIWVMKEYGIEDSWEKLFSFPDERLVHLKQLENGEILLFCKYKYMVLYNPSTRGKSYLRHGFDFSDVSAYSPTLLRLEDALAGYETCIRNVNSRS